MQLNNLQIKNAKPRDKQYKLFDRDGLYLLIKPKGGKYWRYEFSINKKRSTHSIGTYPKITLQEARNGLIKARDLVTKGINPNQYKKLEELQDNHNPQGQFEAVARAWHNSQSERWSDGHASRVIKQFEQRAFPFIGSIPIAELKAPAILAILRKMQEEGIGESTFKLKQRIGCVFTFAIAEGRISHNPTINLEKALAPKPKERNNPYLTEDKLGTFLRELEHYPGSPLTKLALKLVIYTFLRSSEVRFARWDEFDFDKNEWNIPAERMKADAPHVVPLTPQILNILKEIKHNARKSPFLFPSNQSPLRPFSENTMITALYRMGYKNETTVHGFRGTASTILNEQGFRHDIIERQLSHNEENKIRAAYNHAQYLPERKEMMEWYSQKVEQLSTPASMSTPFKQSA